MKLHYHYQPLSASLKLLLNSFPILTIYITKITTAQVKRFRIFAISQTGYQDSLLLEDALVTTKRAIYIKYYEYLNKVLET